MPYKAKGKCVYKADTGKKVGCTKGPVKKYMAALHANVPDAKNEVNTIGWGNAYDEREDDFAYRIVVIERILRKLGYEPTFVYNYGGQEEVSHADVVVKHPKTNKEISFTVDENKQLKLRVDGKLIVVPKGDGRKIKVTVDGKSMGFSDVVKESKCTTCGGDGWYVEPDEKGEPKQVQCSACQGQGGHKDPEPRLRPSGEPENEPFFESMKLRDIIKEIIGKPQPMTLNGKPIDTGSISIEGVDPSDRPDFVDAYISYAEYKDGTPLTDAEVDQLNQEQGAWINTAINSDTRYL